MNIAASNLPIARKLRTFFDNKSIQITFGLAMGLLMFILLFGFKPINPFNVDLNLDNISLINRDDFVQHYSGWVQYRDSKWDMTNLGKIDGYAYPYGLSIVFTDSIPLFAIPFKILSAFLPNNFQYLGLFTLMSFMLQGAIGVLIMRKFSKNSLIIFASSLLIILSVPMINRAFAHTALTAHWLILLSIYLLLIKDSLFSTKKFIAYWSTIMLLAAMIHPYFLPICGIVLIMSLIQTHTSWVSSMVKFILPITSYLLLFSWIGGFSVSASGSAAGLGCYSMNLLSPIYPSGWSYALSGIKFTKPECGGFEGNNFLGLGIIVMLAFCILYFLYSLYRYRHKTCTTFKKILSPIMTSKGILLMIFIIGVILLALSPIWSIGSTSINLFTRLPDKILGIWSIFRSTGRLFWPIFYLIVLATIFLFIYILQRKFKLNGYYIAIAVLLMSGIQFFDIISSAAYRGKYEKTYGVTHNENRRAGSEYLIKNYCDKKHIIFIGEIIYENDLSILNDFSLQCGATQNKGYYSRAPLDKIHNYEVFITNELKRGIFDKDTLYITNYRDLVKDLYRAKIIKSDNEKVNNDKYILRNM